MPRDTGIPCSENDTRTSSNYVMLREPYRCNGRVTLTWNYKFRSLAWLLALQHDQLKKKPRTSAAHSKRIRAALLPFAEFVSDQLQQRLHRFGFIRAFRFDRYGTADARSKHHDAHDALGIDAPPVAA